MRKNIRWILPIVGLIADVITIYSFHFSPNSHNNTNSLIYILLIYILSILTYFTILDYSWQKSNKNNFWHLFYKNIILKPQSLGFLILALITSIFIFSLPIEEDIKIIIIVIIIFVEIMIIYEDYLNRKKYN